MTNEHTSLEKYTSHFIRKGCERVVCKRWVGEWTDCNILTPSSSDYSSTSFLILLGCLTGGPEGPALCWELVLTVSNGNSNLNCNWLQLTRTVCGIGLYNCLTPTCFPWTSQLHRIQPVHGQGYILISSTGGTRFLIDGWVEGQYVTRVDLIVMAMKVYFTFPKAPGLEPHYKMV